MTNKEKIMVLVYASISSLAATFLIVFFQETLIQGEGELEFFLAGFIPASVLWISVFLGLKNRHNCTVSMELYPDDKIDQIEN